jgi:acyl transferase domain-containing protein
MAKIGELYEKMLLDNPTSSSGTVGAKMYSSVTGKPLSEALDAAYWKSNMVSPVSLTQATTELLQDPEGADFLIQIGPSNALSGPISQIKKSLSSAPADAKYVSALKRGSESTIPLYIMAG